MKDIDKIKKFSDEDMIKYCKNSKLDFLHKLKLYLDDLYYNTDSSYVSDKLYDILKDFLIKNDPDYIPPIGCKIRKHQNRVNLPYWLGSADKITPNELNKLERWKEKNEKVKYIISEKLDGVSGMLYVKNGKKKLYTRGNGTIGADISYIIQYIKNIPKNIPDNICIRGELIIKKKKFNKKYYNGNPDLGNVTDRKLYKNARNMVAGLVGSKIIREGIDDIKFIVYEIIRDETMNKPSYNFDYLNKIGFSVAMNTYIDDLNIQNLSTVYYKFKNDTKYEIDGIIIQPDFIYDRNTEGNPSYLFAFKINDKDDIHKTKVIDIEWSISSWGQIIPVAIIEPVKLSGTTIKRVTVSNAGLLKEKGIGPGSIINVIRSKDVIPFIVSVDKKCKKFKWPNIKYDWDKNNVHIKVVDASDDTLEKMEVKTITNFFQKMGIKFISEKTVSKLYNHGFNTLIKIVRAKKEELVKVEGIHDKSATRIVDNIKKGLTNVNKSNLLACSGSFGYGIGRKRLLSLLIDIPDILDYNKDKLKDRILNVEGFSDIMADKIVSNIDNANIFYNEIKKYATFEHINRVSNVLVGKKFVFSGFRDKNLEKILENKGGKVVSSVSKNTTCIVVSDENYKHTSKIKTAVKLNIKIYTKDEFKNKYKV